MRAYGYTLSEVMAEDAHALFQHLALLDPDVGKAQESDG